MPRRVRRRGRLIQKPKNKIVKSLFRVIASHATGDVWTEGEYGTFEDAKRAVDSYNTPQVDYLIYSDKNRVLYTKKGE